MIEDYDNYLQIVKDQTYLRRHVTKYACFYLKKKSMPVSPIISLGFEAFTRATPKISKQISCIQTFSSAARKNFHNSSAELKKKKKRSRVLKPESYSLFTFCKDISTI
jgi:hypothetical protein